jgi:hypothetical protein
MIWNHTGIIGIWNPFGICPAVAGRGDAHPDDTENGVKEPEPKPTLPVVEQLGDQ